MINEIYFGRNKGKTFCLKHIIKTYLGQHPDELMNLKKQGFPILAESYNKSQERSVLVIVPDRQSIKDFKNTDNRLKVCTTKDIIEGGAFRGMRFSMLCVDNIDLIDEKEISQIFMLYKLPKTICYVTKNKSG